MYECALRYCNQIYGAADDIKYKFILVAIPKDLKMGGAVCKSDSGGGLILKRGNRFVQIG